MKLCAHLLAVLTLAFALADARAETRLSAGVLRGFPGATVEVPLRLKLDSNAPPVVVALQADLRFDAGRAQPAVASRGGAASNHFVISRTAAAGVYRLLIYSPANRSLTNGVVASIPFTIASGSGLANVPLTFSNVVVSGPVGGSVNVARSDGAIVMSQVYRGPDGTVDYYLNVQPDQRYVIQASTNLVNWENVSTNESPDTLLFLVDQDAPNHPHRFYRALLYDAPTGVRLGAVTRLPGQLIAFEFAGVVGHTYVLESSTNLVTWRLLGAQSTVSGALQFTNAINPAVSSEFFRVRSDR